MESLLFVLPAMLGIFLSWRGGSALAAERRRLGRQRSIAITVQRAEVVAVPLPTAVATIELRYLPRIEYSYLLDGVERRSDRVNPDPQSALRESRKEAEQFVEQMRRLRKGYLDEQSGEACLQPQLSYERRRLFRGLVGLGGALQAVAVLALVSLNA